MTIAVNKEAKFGYELLNSYEAGIKLLGAEVKSVKQGHISLKGSYISIDDKMQAWLVNAHISSYKPAGADAFDPDRRRRILLHKKEIAYLYGKSKEKGLTILPIRVYTKGGLIKLELAVARGKKLHDKRQTIKDRQQERDIRRTLKQY